MKAIELISLHDLAELHNENPDLFPVFSKVRRINGEPVGEIVGYSDAFGRRISNGELDKKSVPIEGFTR